MGMLYTAQFNATAVSAQQDFFEILSPSDAVVLVHQVKISQGSDVGDAAEEGLNILVKRGVGSTTGSGGSTPALVPTESGFAAAGSVVKANNTTKMTSGTITTLDGEQWLIRSPYLLLPTPECRLVLSPSQRLTVELATTPADALTVNGTLYFEEIGG